MRMLIGSRGSELALTQTGHVADAIRALDDSLDVDVKIIKTRGDADQTSRLDAMPGIGFFTKELEKAQLDGEVDLAVHSLKDLPSLMPEGLTLAAVPARESVADLLIPREGNPSLADLPKGARIGTGSPRRVAQILAARPDVECAPIRGNVDTRLAKLQDPEQNLDAIVLAEAGLFRSGRLEGLVASPLFPEVVPAVGQGALGIQCRSDDTERIAILNRLEDPSTRRRVEAERHVMGILQGGCTIPLGAYASEDADGTLILVLALARTDGSTCLRAEARGTEPKAVAEDAIAQLRTQGADEILEELNRE